MQYIILEATSSSLKSKSGARKFCCVLSLRRSIGMPLWLGSRLSLRWPTSALPVWGRKKWLFLPKMDGWYCLKLMVPYYISRGLYFRVIWAYCKGDLQYCSLAQTGKSGLFGIGSYSQRSRSKPAGKTMAEIPRGSLLENQKDERPTILYVQQAMLANCYR